MITTKKGNGKLPLFCGNREQVIPIYTPNKTVKTCQANTGDNELILNFWWKFTRPPSPSDILIKQNASEIVDKGNIQGAFYIPKLEGLGGGQRRR